MAYELKEGNINIFKNKKRENENQPEYKGEAMINGQLVDIAFWAKVTKNGEKYFSGKIQNKRNQ